MLQSITTLKQQFTNPMDLTEKLKTCLGNEQENKWNLCSICHEIIIEKEWKNKRFNSLRQYLNELSAHGYHIKLKTFYDYVNVNRLIIKFDIQKSDFMKIGFYKLREISYIVKKVDEEKIAELLSKLPYLSVKEIKRIKNEILYPERSVKNEDREFEVSEEDIRELERMHEEEEEKYNSIQNEQHEKFYYLYCTNENEAETVEKALNIAKKLTGKDYDSTFLFLYICEKFIYFYEKELIRA
ncbi:MAG: hypothetical protein NC926_08610 [Candidatus Omnitrophica bacterium]|nr:hypothetical protein [Candidatus Omnitrophota bacterium]